MVSSVLLVAMVLGVICKACRGTLYTVRLTYIIVNSQLSKNGELDYSYNPAVISLSSEVAAWLV